MVLSSSLLKTFMNQVAGAIVWKDKECIFLGVNDEYTRVFGFKSPESLIGKTDFDLQCKAVENAGRFRNLDKQVLSTGETLNALEIHHYATGTAVHYVVRKRLYDVDGTSIGMICHGIPLSNDILIKTAAALLKMDPQKVPMTGSYTLVRKNIENLSERESECLFYLLRGKTAKEIGFLLHISHRTVENHIERIKTKFDCQTKSQLFAYSIEKGFLYLIPERLAIDGIYKIL